MLKFEDIPKIYKAAVVLVIVTVFVIGYHDQFLTVVEAAEQQKQSKDEIRLLRVDGYETEKRQLVREKAEAVEQKKPAKAEILEQDIQTLRDKIKSLCDQLEDC